MTTVALSCRCGEVKGLLHNASPSVGNRIICYCNSCRKFCTLLGAESGLDEYGGTEIYQVPIASVEFTEGKDRLKCLRLTENAPYRWYSSCCQTPIGNTGPSFLPMMGVIHTCVTLKDRDDTLGPITLDANTRDALKPLPPERQRGNMPAFVIRFFLQMIYWKLTKSRPNPGFDSSGNPIAVPSIGSVS